MRRTRSSTVPGFTLIEMLVAIVVLLMIMALIFEMTSQTGNLWKNTTSKIQAFQGTRAGFESMSRRISQATLSTYYDYFDSNHIGGSSASYNGTPVSYGRQSNLHFISGPGLLTTPAQVTHAIFFQAPLGYSSSTNYAQLNSTLNAVGYYITYNSDAQAGMVPSFVSTLPTYTPKYRYRLMQFTQTTEKLNIFVSPATTTTSWFTSFITTSNAATTSPTHLLAENVIALVIVPKRSTEDDPTGTALSPSYIYDSRTAWTGSTQPAQANQLPPVVHIAMLALDEPSAKRICTTATAPDTILGLSTLFTGSAGHAAQDMTTDLNTLQTTLNQNKLTYRLFETDVAIRGAKWSN